MTPRNAASGRFVEDNSFNYRQNQPQAVARERGAILRAWEQLRGARLTPVLANLNDRLPSRIQERFAPLVAAGEASELPTTYEAAMRILVTDQDQNGNFDLNIDRLVESGIVARRSSSTSMEALKRRVEVALTGPAQGIGTQTVEDQVGGDATDWAGDINDTGNRLIEDTRATRFTASSARDVSEFLRTAGPRMRNNAGAVAGDAVARAQEWIGEGRRDAAGALLFRTANELIQAGKHQQASRVLEALRGDNLRGTKLNEMGFPQLPLNEAGSRPVYMERSGPGGRVSYTFDPDDHLMSPGSAAQRLQSQIDFRSGMTGVLGPTADPYDLGQVREYFQSMSDGGASTGELASQMREYAETFYVHSGKGVSYPGWSNVDARPGAAQEIMNSTLQTQAGRRVVDCEGFTYLMHNIGTGITAADGGPRFDGHFVSTETHITLLLNDRMGDQIYVDNDGIGERNYENPGEAIVAVVNNMLGSVRLGQTKTRSVRINEQPGSTDPFDDDGNPVEGTFVGTMSYTPDGLDTRYAGVTTDFRTAFIDYFDAHPDRRASDDTGPNGAHDENVQRFLEAHPEFYVGSE